MPFKESKEGQTHYFGDGCKPPHRCPDGKCKVAYNNVCVTCNLDMPHHDSWRHAKGEKSRRWKGDKASKSAIHKWLYVNVGRPTSCSNKGCLGRSKIFEWCLKTGRTYTHDPDDYLWLCRSCHRKYDLTEEKRLQAVRNLVLNNPHVQPEDYKTEYRELV